MATIWLERTVSGVRCDDQEALPETWKVGDVLRAEVTKPRNGGLHRKAFVLLRKVHPHTEYPNQELLRKAMTIGAGFVEPVTNPMTGDVALVPRSWEFNQMDDLEFEELYSRLIDVALKIVPGSQRDDWEAAVNEIVRM